MLLPEEKPATATQTVLDPAVQAALTDAMKQVVTNGTGTAAKVVNQIIAGKTGTAEFGSGDPPPTHAWFVGFRGDLAVAVLVEGGGRRRSGGGAGGGPVLRRHPLTPPDLSGWREAPVTSRRGGRPTG